ncbi:universal stress protein [Pseudonocardia sp. GCM10023141]|uniref:universal stress protein n=1 Tax=Pseudonocardia sp. GCM10023141 TaxID=3252653 RepID=UPI0036156AA3
MNGEQAGRPIVVGVDGSGSAVAAVRWAAAEAGRRHVPLRLVSAVRPTPVGEPGLGAEYRQSMWGYAHDRLTEARAVVAEEAAATAVEDVVLDGNPVSCLLEQAGSATLVVIGDRGLGGITGLLLGSVAFGLAARATCPVVVVRGEVPPGGPVVVGVDGSPVSEAALAFAFEEAGSRGVALVAVHVWVDTILHPATAQSWEWERVEQHQHDILDGRLAGWGHKYPDVEIRKIIARDRPASVLVEQSAGAQLLVVGSRGRGGVSGLVLGSVSHAVLHGAECPVAVVRSEEVAPA